MKTRLGFGDFALIFKVIAERTKSNLSVCGGVTFIFLNNI